MLREPKRRLNYVYKTFNIAVPTSFHTLPFHTRGATCAAIICSLARTITSHSFGRMERGLFLETVNVWCHCPCIEGKEVFFGNLVAQW